MCIIATDSVNSKSWIQASKDIKLNISVENYVSTLNMPGKSLEEVEFQGWESLSDEAFLDFEQSIA